MSPCIAGEAKAHGSRKGALKRKADGLSLHLREWHIRCRSSRGYNPCTCHESTPPTPHHSPGVSVRTWSGSNRVGRGPTSTPPGKQGCRAAAGGWTRRSGKMGNGAKPSSAGCGTARLGGRRSVSCWRAKMPCTCGTPLFRAEHARGTCWVCFSEPERRWRELQRGHWHHGRAWHEQLHANIDRALKDTAEHRLQVLRQL